MRITEDWDMGKASLDPLWVICRDIDYLIRISTKVTLLNPKYFYECRHVGKIPRSKTSKQFTKIKKQKSFSHKTIRVARRTSSRTGPVVTGPRVRPALLSHYRITPSPLNVLLLNLRLLHIFFYMTGYFLRNIGRVLGSCQ